MDASRRLWKCKNIGFFWIIRPYYWLLPCHGAECCISLQIGFKDDQVFSLFDLLAKMGNISSSGRYLSQYSRLIQYRQQGCERFRPKLRLRLRHVCLSIFSASFRSMATVTLYDIGNVAEEIAFLADRLHCLISTHVH
jgi:hypothetical protein